MAAPEVKLPPGFVLDSQPGVKLPPGFTLDQPAPMERSEQDVLSPMILRPEQQTAGAALLGSMLVPELLGAAGGLSGATGAAARLASRAVSSPLGAGAITGGTTLAAGGTPREAISNAVLTAAGLRAVPGVFGKLARMGGGAGEVAAAEAAPVVSAATKEAVATAPAAVPPALASLAERQAAMKEASKKLAEMLGQTATETRTATPLIQSAAPAESMAWANPAAEWLAKYNNPATSKAEKLLMIKGLGGKLNYQDMKELAAAPSIFDYR